VQYLVQICALCTHRLVLFLFFRFMVYAAVVQISHRSLRLRPTLTVTIRRIHSHDPLATPVHIVTLRCRREIARRSTLNLRRHAWPERVGQKVKLSIVYFAPIFLFSSLSDLLGSETDIQYRNVSVCDFCVLQHHVKTKSS